MMKYIIIESGGLEVPFMFPDTIQHDSFYNRIAASSKVVSAGFIRLNFDNEIRTGGNSFSLNLKSRPQDAELITKHLKGV